MLFMRKLQEMALLDRKEIREYKEIKDHKVFKEIKDHKVFKETQDQLVLMDRKVP